MRVSRVMWPVGYRKLRWWMLLATLLTLLSIDGAAVRADPEPAALAVVRAADGREIAPNRIIIGYQPGVDPAAKDAIRRTVVGRSAVTVTSTKAIGDHADVVEVSGKASLDDTIASYQADPRVRYAEPDYVMRVLETPDDTNFSQQYGMTKIQAPTAWGVTHGSATVKIAILDCGIYEAHPDLSGKVVAREDFSGSTTGTDDRCNHGTHVAGIASADTNNDTGVAGVGYETSLMNGKVLSDGGTGYESQITQGVHWAANNGANVINLSLGGPGACAQAYQDAIDYAWSKNVVVVVAAGNNGGAGQMQPADCNHVVSVASTDSTDAKSGFSNYGTWVSVAAPGTNILSSVNPNLNNGMLYDAKSGTSMATPHVAGLAALIWSTRFGTSAESVVQRLESTADVIAGTGTNWQYGRINAAAAVGGAAPVTSGLNVTAVTAGAPSLSLTVTGANFQTGASLLWNGTAKPTIVTDSTHLAATISAPDLANPSTVAITVQNPDGTVSSPTLTLTIFAVPPQITGLTPPSGSTGGGETVTISGAHFQPGLTVTFGGTAAKVTGVTATAVTVTTPQHMDGPVDVTVTNPDGQQQTRMGGYTYVVVPLTRPAAVIPDTSPASAPAPRAVPGAAPGSANAPPAPEPMPTHR